jgi:arylsulfatase A-like enzyme
MFTGLLPKVFGPFNYESRVVPEARMLAERLRDEGYYTGAFGSNPLLGYRRGYKQGFRSYEVYPHERPSRTVGSRLLVQLQPDNFRLDATTEQLHERAADWLSRNRNREFFLWLHFADPHSPFEAPSEYMLPGEPPEAFRDSGHLARADLRFVDPVQISEEERQWVWNLYLAEVRYVDDYIGRTLNHLKVLGLYDSSLIIFTSDHGEEFWEHDGHGHGHTLYEELLKVPLMVKLPGQARTHRIAQPVSGISLTPTVLDLLDVEYDSRRLAGPSLRPLLLGEDESVKTMPMMAADPQRSDFLHDRSIRYEEYKLIIDKEGEPELYDLEADPSESQGLEEEAREVLGRGKERLRRKLELAESLRKEHGIEKFDPVIVSPHEIEHLQRLGYL